ncbi:MAG: thiol:disulfide interchange protein DsbA/DsbL [Rudaea sp.]
MILRSLGLFAALVAPLAFGADAAPAAWKVGTDYELIEPPVAQTAPGKIEVTEVFSYGCPVCNFSVAAINKIRKGLPPNAVMTFVPASFIPAEDWPMFQRAYLTSQALGIAEQSHDAMFDAVWKTKELATMNDDGRTLKKSMPTIEDAAKFYAKFGVKAEDFVATANSFSINTKMKQADAYVKATQTDGTPMIIVAGKYRLIASQRDWSKAEQLIHYLIQLETAAK